MKKQRAHLFKSAFHQLLVLGLLTGSLVCQAYQSFLDTGEILAPGQYRLTAETQAIFTDFDGFNVGARMGAHLNKDSELQWELGVGTVEVQATGYIKYIPFPDIDQQPALGLRAGISYGRIEGDSLFGIHLQPMISKSFDTQKGI